MRKNHISGYLKRVLAVACAAAMVATSVPTSVAFATESTGDNLTNETAQVDEPTNDTPATEEDTKTSGGGENTNTTDPEKSGEQSGEGGDQTGEGGSQTGEGGSQTTDSSQDKTTDGNQDKPTDTDQGQTTKDDTQKTGDDSGKTTDDGGKKTDGDETTEENKDKKEYAASISITPDSDVYVGDKISFAVDVKDSDDQAVSDFDVEWKIDGVKEVKTTSSFETTAAASGDYTAEATIKIDNEVVATAKKEYSILGYKMDFTYDGYDDDKFGVLNYGDTLKISAVIRDNDGKPITVDNDKIEWTIRKLDGSEEVKTEKGTVLTFEASDKASETGTYGFQANYKDGDILLAGGGSVFTVLRTYTVIYHNGTEESDTDDQYVDDDFNSRTDDHELKEFSDIDDFSQKEGYTFIGWSTKEKFDDIDCELYHCNDGKWYTKDGEEFAGFGVLDDNAVDLYAQWADTTAPDIKINVTSTQFSKTEQEYSQDKVIVTDTGTGIGNIYYAVLETGKEPDENTKWSEFDLDENDTSKYSFTVPVGSKGVLHVKAEDKSNTKFVFDGNAVSVNDAAPNTNYETGFSLVIEDKDPEVTLKGDKEGGNWEHVYVTVNEMPDNNYSGIKTVDYKIIGTKYNESKKKDEQEDITVGQLYSGPDAPASLADLKQTFEQDVKLEDIIDLKEEKYKAYKRIEFKAIVKDYCGNEKEETAVIRRDLEPPKVSIDLVNTDGTENYINAKGDKLIINVTEDTNEVSGTVTITNEDVVKEVINIERTGEKSVVLDKYEEGEYTIKVDVQDGSKNSQKQFSYTVNGKNEKEKQDSVTFVVDTIAPEATIVYALNENGGNYFYNTDADNNNYYLGTVYTHEEAKVKIIITGDNIESNVSEETNKIAIMQNNSEKVVIEAGDTVYPIDAETAYFYKVYGKDKAGNAVKVHEELADGSRIVDPYSKDVSLSSEVKDAEKPYKAQIRIVYDKTPPEATVEYNLNGSDGYIYKDETDDKNYAKGTVYSKYDPVLKVKITEKNIPAGEKLEDEVNKLSLIKNFRGKEDTESKEFLFEEGEFISKDNNTDGKYYWKIFGTDKAGNELTVKETFGEVPSINDNRGTAQTKEDLDTITENIGDPENAKLSYCIIRDTTPPRADIEYSLNGSTGYLYTDKDETDDKNFAKGTVYSNCNPLMKVKITEENIPAGDNLKTEVNSLSMVKYFNSKEVTDSKEYLTENKEYSSNNNKTDGKYYWKVFGTDKAGNKLEVRESFDKTTTIAGEDNEKLASTTKDVDTLEKAKLSYSIVRDTVNPVATFDANTPGSRGGIVTNGVWRSYFNKEDNTIGTPEFTIDETNFDGARIEAGYLHKTGSQYSSVTIDEWNSDNTDAFKESENVYSIDGNSLEDGVYRFTIEGEDKAGNRIVAGSSAEINKLDDAGNGELWTSYKIIDSLPPKMTLTVGQGKDGGSITGVFYRVNQESLLTYSPFRKVKQAYGSITTGDKSGTSIGYKVDSTVNSSDRNVVLKNEGFSDNRSVSFATTNAEQVFRVLNVEVEDRAGNKALLATSGSEDYLYLDVTRPTNDNIKPRVGITRKSTPSITRMMGKDGQSVDLYNKNVTLGLNVFDPDKFNSSSGLKQIRVYTTMDGSDVSGANYTFDVNFKGDKGDKKGIKPSELTYQWTKDITFPAGSFQSNNILIRVEAIDNSGNVAATKEYNFGIDTIGPKVTVYFENNDAQNGKYFKADRRARIEFIDRNIDWGMITISTQGSVGGENVRGGEGNGGNDVWSRVASYTVDGDYTLTVTGTDALGNAFVGSVDYTGGGRNVAPREFTIDKTAPVINVSFDNNSAQNGKYYKDARTATISVREHNFNASEVKVTQTADIQQGSVSAPGVGGFGGGGDDHSASIHYGEDGNYTLTVNYTDLAGNPAQEVRVDEFVIDQTPPTLKFVMPDETKGTSQIFAGDIAPQIDFGDINMTRGMASISLTGMKANSNALKLIEDSFENFQGTVRYENLKKVRESDDIYTATAVVTDLAGNTVEKTITFSVNRFGSTYDYNKNDFTTNLVSGYYTNEPKDVILREINVNQLSEHKLTLYKDGDNRILKEGTDYSFEERLVNGHYEYIYTIFAKNFEEEGNYNIIATSKDKANNTNSNSTVKGDDGSNEVPLRFAVDKTAPTNLITGVDITKNKFTEDHITLYIEPRDNMNAVASFIVRVTDKNGNILQEFEISGKELAEYFEKNKGVYTLTIDQNNQWQTIEVVTTDAAGNESVDHRIEQNTAYKVLVTPNLFYQYINRLPLVGGSLAALAGLIFFLIAKRKKDDEEEENAA